MSERLCICHLSLFNSAYIRTRAISLLLDALCMRFCMGKRHGTKMMKKPSHKLWRRLKLIWLKSKIKTLDTSLKKHARFLRVPDWQSMNSCHSTLEKPQWHCNWTYQEPIFHSQGRNQCLDKKLTEETRVRTVNKRWPNQQNLRNLKQQCKRHLCQTTFTLKTLNAKRLKK